MKILLLSARPDLEVNRRLEDASQALGVELRTVDATRVTAGTGRFRSLYLGREDLLDPLPDAILARVGNWRPESLLAQLEVAEQRGVWTPNSAAAMRVARDHWVTVATLNAAGLPVPETMVGADPEQLAAQAERLGYPVVVKQRRSRMGVGVIRCAARDHLESVLDSLWRVGDEFLIQRWVESAGVSLRLLVVGGQLVTAASFCAVAGEWRSNAARGGSARDHRASRVERQLAERAAAAAGLGICGVDLLPRADGPLVCELNPTPGFRHLQQVSGEDVASHMVRYIIGAVS